MDNICSKLFTELDGRMSPGGKWACHIDSVVIENQPVLKNPTMKTLQVLIYGYFQHLRYVTSTSSFLGEVVFVSAVSKLKVKDVQLVEAKKRKQKITPETPLPSSYRDNKASGIATTRFYLESCVEGLDTWLPFMESHPKKDDLCDSFLLGVAKMEKKAQKTKVAPKSVR
jgi:hypothetical protein